MTHPSDLFGGQPLRLAACVNIAVGLGAGASKKRRKSYRRSVEGGNFNSCKSAGYSTMEQDG